MHAKIIGTGAYLPETIVTNHDLEKYLDTSDEWITSRTGIKQRHIANPSQGETSSYMAFMAATKALAMANIDPSQLDLIITATITPDLRVPTTSCLLQERLQAINVPAFDLQAACAGSIYSLAIINSFITSGMYKNVLYVGVEMMSSIVDKHDRNTAVLFGDGASAALLTASDNDSGFIDFDLYADGRMKDVISIKAGGSSCPLDQENALNHKINMNGRETFKFAVRSICDASEKILHDNNLSIDDIDFIVPHQANLRIIEAIASRINVPLDRFLLNLDKCANTSAASLMLVYDEANRKNYFKTGNMILMLAIGAGFTWGASLYRV